MVVTRDPPFEPSAISAVHNRLGHPCLCAWLSPSRLPRRESALPIHLAALLDLPRADRPPRPNGWNDDLHGCKLEEYGGSHRFQDSSRESDAKTSFAFCIGRFVAHVDHRNLGSDLEALEDTQFPRDKLDEGRCRH